jgi:hypothetical protein
MHGHGCGGFPARAEAAEASTIATASSSSFQLRIDAMFPPLRRKMARAGQHSVCTGQEL